MLYAKERLKSRDWPTLINNALRSVRTLES